MQNNAKQQLQDACSQLKNITNGLNQAIVSVEKQENRQEIENTLNAINNASSVGENALNNFRD